MYGPTIISRMIKGIFTVLSFLGLAMATFGVYFMLYGNAAQSWPSVEGRIISVQVRIYISIATSTYRSRGERDQLRTYYPQVTYT